MSLLCKNGVLFSTCTVLPQFNHKSILLFLNFQNFKIDGYHIIGTALLDKFTHCLLVKCSAEMLDTLLSTLIRQLQTTTSDTIKQTEAKSVIRRFVRSVARIFVALSVESSPGHNKKKTPARDRQPLQACKRVFQALINISIEELCETGNALLAPVRLGVARPTAPCSLSSASSDSLSVMDELFNVDPLAKNDPGSKRPSRRRR